MWDLDEVLTVVEQNASRSNGTASDDPEQHVLLHDLQQHVLALIEGLPLKRKSRPDPAQAAWILLRYYCRKPAVFA